MMPHATRQLNAIAIWWRANRPEAPELATDEVLAAVASLEHNPGRGIRVAWRGEDRRMLVTSRTKLLIVYRIRPRARRVEILRIKRP
jgi:plasmid stabilization system protein ParE